MAKGMIWRENFLESREAVPQIPIHPIQAVRPRSLYTAHSYLAEEVSDNLFCYLLDVALYRSFCLLQNVWISMTKKKLPIITNLVIPMSIF